MPEISDLVIERACSGDRRAFDEIYRAHSGMVYNVAFRMTGHLEIAGEITQDVFMAVFRKLVQFRGQSKLKTWIYRITVNTALNFRRKESVEKEHLRAYAVEKKILEPTVASQPDHEAFDRVQELMMVLPPEQRVCMLLRSIEQLSYQEIADVLEININTVRTRLKRARESLFAKLRGGTHEV